jgi:hypothetical protein
MEGDQDAVQRIIQVLKSLSRDVETLQSYSASQEALSNKEKETVFETFVAATNFFCDAIRFLRDEDHFARGKLLYALRVFAALFDDFKIRIPGNASKISSMSPSTTWKCR